MALSNKERQALKDKGYVYDRKLGKWLLKEEQERYYKRVEQLQTAQTWIALVVAIGIFIWIFAAST